MQKRPLAHIRRDGNGETFQTLEEHCNNTARYAAASLAEVSLSSTAYLAGLVHDMGKATERFQDYLCRAARGERVVRGSVNHTFAAVRFLLDRYHDGEKWGAYGPMTAEWMAYAAGAHHGLFDCVDAHHRSGFHHRLEKEEIGYEEALSNFLAECAGTEEMDRLFLAATEEVERVTSRLLPLLGPLPSSEESAFHIGLLARLLLSAVEEGDRRDTAAYLWNLSFPPSWGREERIALWKTLSARVDDQIAGLPEETPVQKARQAISRQCRAFAAQPGGVYRLHVPTGAGKTLSSLRYALAHAAIWGKSRIIFTAPLLSILEQNASVIRRYIQDDALILEHHSNVVRSHEDNRMSTLTELLMTTWDAPIIMTTLVQFLNTLFDGDSGSIRRFHSLCGSVIVIDEVQTVPGNLLSLFHLAVGFLAGVCGATVVLCSATQPCSEAAAHPIAGSPRDMVPYDPALWRAFQRTQILDAGSWTLESIPELIAEQLADANSLLMVCNKKAEAETLYRTLPAEAYLKFHLSAAMCTAHRRRVLAALQTALCDPPPEKKIVCVSTQVIEAGVDISFARVIRLTAGMDSIVQSAGRYNRNGERAVPASVCLVQCVGENLQHLPEIQRAKSATLALLQAFHQYPAQFGNDLTSDEAIRYYYCQLYQKEMPPGLQDGPVTAGGKKTTLFSLLSDNHDFADLTLDAACAPYLLKQAFKTAGQCFTVFDNETTDVLVPYRQGRELILELGALRLPDDFQRMRTLLDAAKSYTVSLYGWQKKQLEAQHALVFLCEGSVLALQEGYYDAAVGFQTEQNTLEFWEV